ncbi:hypothetical protein HJD18_03500 [Thermoleophilia bacterium SCSIO 60948]|nr:hypothetical protein HJD18_03500 [Thermoleophilia bacterium SCSIO 60948]
MQRTLSILFFAALTALLPVTAPGWETEADADTRPGRFADDRAAALTDVGDDLWLFTSGRTGPSAPVRVRAFLRVGSSWEPAPPIPGAIDDGYTIEAASLSDELPCVGLTRPSGDPSVLCLENGEWIERLPDVGFEGAYLNDLRSQDGELSALLYRYPSNTIGSAEERGRRLSRARVYTIPAEGLPTATPTAVFPPSIINLAQTATGPPAIDVFDQGRRGSHYVIGLSGDSWEPITPNLKDGFGPSTSGAIVAGEAILMASTNVNPKPWAFSVFATRGERWKRFGSRVLNRGPGNAQGAVALTAAGQSWAIWQQHAYRRKAFDTRVLVAKLEPGIAPEPELIYSGRTSFPGDLDVVSTGDRTFALFARGTGRHDENLRAAVKRIE